MNISEFAECCVTYEQHLAEFEIIENKIAEKFNLTNHIDQVNYTGTIRESVIYYIWTFNPEEDELIQSYNQMFSSHYNWLEDEFIEEFVNLYVFTNLCHYYNENCYSSLIKRKSIYYQNLLSPGKLNVIPSLIKYICFGWPVFHLLQEISKKDMSNFNQDFAGIYDEVRDYWLNWAKIKGITK